MQVIGAGDARIPGTEIASIEVIAGRPVDALHLLVTEIERTAVVQPQNLRLLCHRDGISRVCQDTDNHLLEFRAACGRGLMATAKLPGVLLLVTLQIARRCVQERKVRRDDIGKSPSASR
jgi:hypothetical protein